MNFTKEGELSGTKEQTGNVCFKRSGVCLKKLRTIRYYLKIIITQLATCKISSWTVFKQCLRDTKHSSDQKCVEWRTNSKWTCTVTPVACCLDYTPHDCVGEVVARARRTVGLLLFKPACCRHERHAELLHYNSAMRGVKISVLYSWDLGFVSQPYMRRTPTKWTMTAAFNADHDAPFINNSSLLWPLQLIKRLILTQ